MRTLEGPRHVIEIEDARYPGSLKELQQPPEKLFVIGSPEVLVPGLAVIGARKATPYGISCAKRFARIAAEKGAVIISGGARGCDAEAHRAALAAGAPTVVFLGGGCDRLYPAEHFSLFQEVISSGGAVVSENAWDFQPMPYTFRARNRLIAGLAEAVLIVEAGLPSGTFSTADEALGMGKEVLVVPGAITSKSSQGSNRLLYQGAVPVVDDESFEDILFSVLGMLKRPGAGRDSCTSDESPLIQAVLAAPCTIEEVYRIAVGVVGEQNARRYAMSEIARAESLKLIARGSDGRWGPVVRAEL